MISNEERREVASRLRYEESADPGCLNMIVEWYLISFLQSINRAVDNGTEYHLRERLADLIDRPTCDVRMGVTGHIGVCMRCGAMVKMRAAVFDAIEALPTRYCPNCGTEMIPHAQRRD